MVDKHKDAVISAFTESQVAKLTGLTVHRLRYWDRTQFFAPSFAAESRRFAYSRIYSFQDVAALRVLSVLINQYNVAVRHLRAVAKKLCRMDNSAWYRTKLYVLNRRVIFDDPEVGKQREVVSGQYMIGIPLKKVLSETRRDIDALSRRTSDTIGKFEKKRFVSHNARVISGTRVPVRAIRAFAEDGYSIEEILEEYPSLDRKDVKAAIDSADQDNAA